MEPHLNAHYYLYIILSKKHCANHGLEIARQLGAWRRQNRLLSNPRLGLFDADDMKLISDKQRIFEKRGTKKTNCKMTLDQGS
jgi:hypothetical protein